MTVIKNSSPRIATWSSSCRSKEISYYGRFNCDCHSGNIQWKSIRTCLNCGSRVTTLKPNVVREDTTRPKSRRTLGLSSCRNSPWSLVRSPLSAVRQPVYENVRPGITFLAARAISSQCCTMLSQLSMICWSSERTRGQTSLVIVATTQLPRGKSNWRPKWERGLAKWHSLPHSRIAYS